MRHDFAADKGFQWERREHVQPEAEARDVDHDVCFGEVVEHVALGEGAEGKEAREGHGQAGEHGDGGAEVGYAGETVDGGGFEGAIDEEGIVMAYKCCCC